MKIHLGPTALPLHKQLGVSEESVSREQTLLSLCNIANARGWFSAERVRSEHQKIIGMLKAKGVLENETH